MFDVADASQVMMRLVIKGEGTFSRNCWVCIGPN